MCPWARGLLKEHCCAARRYYQTGEEPRCHRCQPKAPPAKDSEYAGKGKESQVKASELPPVAAGSHKSRCRRCGE